MNGQPSPMPFGKHPALLVRQTQPFNAEPPLYHLRQHYVTPTQLCFVRNHGSIPEVDLATYRLAVGGMVRQPLRLSFDELKSAFPKHEVMATLQCAGNRRKELVAVEPIPDEIEWDVGAISNMYWGGVALREVLLAAGVDPRAQHAAFTGLDDVQVDDQAFGFGGSLPTEKALHADVLLAYEMNGEPLSHVHGFPLRVVAPGYIAARSVKWLSRIMLQAEPSDNYFQAHAYRLFPPHVRADTVGREQGVMLGELPVNCVICCPLDCTALPAGRISVQGYAMVGGGRCVERVDVSADGGQTWTIADVQGEAQPWAWRFWEAQFELAAGQYQLVARAWDSAANTQPEQVRHVWNFKGYMNNAWHRVNVAVR